VDFDKLKRQQRFRNKNKKDKQRRLLINREKTKTKAHRPKFYFDPDAYEDDFTDDEALWELDE